VTSPVFFPINSTRHALPLNIDPNLAEPDETYQALIDMHRDLSPAQSELVNARLILLLANHVGDAGVLREAMARARQDVKRD